MNEFGQLRPMVDEDLEMVLDWRNAPEVRSKMYTSHVISLEEHLAWWGRTKQRDDQKYFVYECAGTPLGVVGFTQIDYFSQNCFWAFYASSNAPRGTGSRMEYLALNYVFKELGLNKLSCEVLRFNETVLRLHTKFGFKKEGLFRQQYMVDGVFHDIVRFGLLESEWQQICEEVHAKLSGNSA
jgi:UDP-4-amino-4,6-dideoxy-N-acetyl-beta-L-altrosamine N-acetyltransferase